MGHRYGDSPEYYKAIEYADEQVGRIWKAIQLREQNYNEDWLIIVTTDHGRDAKTGRDHGGQSDRERAGWIITNAKDLNTHFNDGDASQVDIMPTIARFLGVNIPKTTLREIDGIPLIGALSITDPKISYENGNATVTWNAINKEGMVKIFVTPSNNYKTGGVDNYTLVKQVSVKSQKAVIDLQKMPSSFYKIVLEGKWNTVNRWIIDDSKKSE
jgi:hypothetical protein